MSSRAAQDFLSHDSATPFRVAVGVSILLHILIFMPGFAKVMTGEGDLGPEKNALADDAAPPEEAAKERPEQPREIRLGIAESSSTTLNWIGYREYEEHLARLAEIDQAALRMNAAGPEGPPTDAPNEGPEVGPTEVAEATPPTPPAAEPATPTAPPPPTTLAQATPPVDRPEQEAPPAPSEPAAEAPAGTRPDALPEQPSEPTPETPPETPEPKPQEQPKPEEPAPQPEPQPEQAEPTPPTPPAPPSPQAPPPQPAGGGSRGIEDPVGSGERAEAESDPTSIQNVPTNLWRNGRPIAAQGLTIRTRKPRFTVLTMVTARPVNPIVEIKFDREGRPRHYEFLRRSGHPDVDGPILDAIAGWRASGEVLEALRPGDTTVVRLRLILQE